MTNLTAARMFKTDPRELQEPHPKTIESKTVILANMPLRLKAPKNLIPQTLAKTPVDFDTFLTARYEADIRGSHHTRRFGLDPVVRCAVNKGLLSFSGR